MARWRPEIASDAFAAAASLRAAVTEAEASTRARPAARDAVEPAPIATVAASAFDAATLDQALDRDGALVVRGLATAERCTALARAIAAACEGRDRFDDSSRASPDAYSGAFDPFVSDGELNTPLPLLRHVARFCEAVMVAEAPSVLDHLVLLLAESGLLDVVAEHLGESPAVSIDKLIARRVPRTINDSFLPERWHPGWHQDGVDWDQRTRALNVWIAFDDCGPETGRRSIEIHPRPVRDVLPAALGDDPAAHIAAMEQIHGATASVELSLGAGDGVLFDHLHLHRTAGGRDFAEARTSAEFWFFAPSCFPTALTPLELVSCRVASDAVSE